MRLRALTNLLQAEQALLSVHCDQKTIETVWKNNSESQDCLQWKKNAVSLESFTILYAEARHKSLGVTERWGRGLLDAPAGYVRGGLQRLAGEQGEEEPL